MVPAGARLRAVSAPSTIGGAYASLGELQRRREYFIKAFDLREHASEREKLIIASRYYEDVTGEPTVASRIAYVMGILRK